MGVNPNGFTEPTIIKDYPTRNRKVLFHVRRKRYLDAENRNVIDCFQLANDETKVEMLTRPQNMLAQSSDKWEDSKKERARLLFEQYPKMREAYSLICKVRTIFKMKISREEAKKRLPEWYKKVKASTLREVKAARNAIQGKEDYVLNYLLNRIALQL